MFYLDVLLRLRFAINCKKNTIILVSHEQVVYNSNYNIYFNRPFIRHIIFRNAKQCDLSLFYLNNMDCIISATVALRK